MDVQNSVLVIVNEISFVCSHSPFLNEWDQTLPAQGREWQAAVPLRCSACSSRARSEKELYCFKVSRQPHGSGAPGLCLAGITSMSVSGMTSIQKQSWGLQATQLKGTFCPLVQLFTHTVLKETKVWPQKQSVPHSTISMPCYINMNANDELC